jgi:hypothetical protein
MSTAPATHTSAAADTRHARRVSLRAWGWAAHVVLIAVAAVALAVPAMTYDAPLAGYAGSDAETAMSQIDRSDNATNVPVWEAAYAAEFPGCAETLPAGVIPATVIEVTIDADVRRVTFSDASQRIDDDNPWNHGWIVGQCR